MDKKPKMLIIAIIILVAVSAAVFIWREKGFIGLAGQAVKPPEETTYKKKLEIVDGATYGKLLTEAGVSAAASQQIFDAAETLYDLSKIKLGQKLELVYDKNTNELKQLVYQIDTEEELFVSLTAATEADGPPVWVAERKAIPYEVKIKTVSGTIETSLYEAALGQGIDERAVIGLADAFQWTIDFAWEVRQGDSFKFIYEERYLDGQYIMPGQILAGKFINQGKPFYAFYYEESPGNSGFFNENGESAQKIFLKAPVAFRYISSGFTTGLRYVKAFNVSTGHRAIDYAANYGAPIQSVGDGVVSFAGWNGAYGNMVKVRHNGTYATNYGHMSRLAVKRGQTVKQGQTIGFVGSTGFSTGPHVHYEMEKNGV
ncbi:MAG: peptidoglycan DD-metalloendopeptidase family protein, partial [Patescibacteria group bacterium]